MEPNAVTLITGKTPEGGRWYGHHGRKFVMEMDPWEVKDIEEQKRLFNKVLEFFEADMK
jgi:hypothetical protein